MIHKEELYQHLNQGMKTERLYAFKKNLIKNMPKIQQHGGLRPIMSRLSGRHAVIIGAGPSFEDDLHLLKKYQQRKEFVYIATDMALKPLCKNGITPEFVISCEAKPAGFFSNILTKNMHLLAFSCISSVNLAKWQGNISFYNWLIDDSDYTVLWKTAGEDLGFLATGSIVTTQAVSLALGCEIQSLVLIGNDLGFTDRFYLKGTELYGKHVLQNNRIDSLETREMTVVRSSREYEIRRDNRVFYTNRQFLAAKLWLEELFSKVNVPVYDCSEPGCSEKSVRKIAVKDFFQYFERKRNKKKRK